MRSLLKSGSNLIGRCPEDRILVFSSYYFSVAEVLSAAAGASRLVAEAPAVRGANLCLDGELVPNSSKTQRRFAVEFVELLDGRCSEVSFLNLLAKLFQMIVYRICKKSLAPRSGYAAPRIFLLLKTNGFCRVLLPLFSDAANLFLTVSWSFFSRSVAFVVAPLAYVS